MICTTHQPLLLLVAASTLAFAQIGWGQDAKRPRAREAGVKIGILPTGPLNAITDVEDVRVGQVSLVRGDDVRTGVTAILPHKGNVFLEKVPAAVHVGNGFGKLVGALQVRELGEIETPVLLTNTLNVWRCADALVSFMLEQEDMKSVRSINPVVGETNDGRLNDIRNRHVDEKAVRKALADARTGPVAEGAVGAGVGTVCFGWKGGIGTSSRVVPKRQGGWTVGVLVQTNYGGDLNISGVPVGRLLKKEQDRGSEDGSCMIVVATDAPLSARNLKRLAARTLLGLGRTGSVMSNGSGDFVITFSTHPGCRRRHGATRPKPVPDLPNNAMTPLFRGAVEATEEAVINSLFKATTTRGAGGRTVRALPLEPTLEILKRHGAIPK